MLDRVYRLGRLFMSKGWIVAFALIVLTLSLGTLGFLNTTFEDGQRHTFLDALYKAAALLAVQTGALPVHDNWELEAARWCGMLVWASALTTIIVSLFREPVHRLVVRRFAQGHVIVAGLGEHGVELVLALRRSGRSVVVIEPDRAHSAVAPCRRGGAIVLFGAPDDPQQLLAAQLPRAQAVLALFGPEAVCVRTATAAYHLLRAEQPSHGKPPVRCVLRLIEPGMLDVLRRHRIKTDAIDRIQLEILNSHEITATTMVREAVANSRTGRIRKLLVLGLGTHHRLGEMVVLRAVKDHLIQHNGQALATERLTIHVFDRQAAPWHEAFQSRYPFAAQFAEITPIAESWARKAGAVKFERDYDAAFVCIADEGHATAQAVMLRREVLTAGQPIMVRVPHSGAGFGRLFGYENSGWGDNLHAVGLEDALFDPHMATQPELEMRAKTIHHDFRALKRREYLVGDGVASGAPMAEQTSNRPWDQLDEHDRDMNRRLAERYDDYLSLCHGQKTRRYRREFAPAHFCRAGGPVLFPFSDDEIEALAHVEHARFVSLRRSQGWTYAPVRDDKALKSPFIREYADLTEEQKGYNREFVKNIPRVLALADYMVVEIR